jgi:Cd2+/Zn2+-exporting ATPase
VLFIIVGLTVTSFGIIGPIVASMLHVTGTMIVIFNSARLVRKGEELEHFHPEMETFDRPAPRTLTPKLA